jgi:hypothetical protein
LLKYTHHKLNEEIEALAGYYVPQKEVKLKYDDREVLYITGHCVIDAACCGAADYGYAIVPGYIVNWHSERNESGLLVSTVEPIRDRAEQEEIRKIIQETECIPSIDFW